MANVLRVVIVDPSDKTREALKSMLLGLDRVWLEAECSRYEFFADVVAQTNPDVGIVAMDANPDKALDLVGTLNARAPKCQVLVTCSSSDGNLILRAMRSGAKEFLTQPLRLQDLLESIDRISERVFKDHEGRARASSVMAVAGAAGGVGTTSIAVNLGCTLAADENKSVALIDLDLCLGDADVFLDTIPDYTLVDVAQNVARLDFSLLRRSLTKHSSGVYLLPRPTQIEDVNLVTTEGLQRVIGLLKATFSHLVLDLSKSYSALDAVALQMADHVLLVTQLDLPCLRNAVRLLMSFNNMKGVADKVKVVVNRAGLESGNISLKKAQETLGRDIFWQLPNDYKMMAEVRNSGVPLLKHAPKAAITHAIAKLAEALHAPPKAAAEQADPGKSGKSKLLGLFPVRPKSPGAKS